MAKLATPGQTDHGPIRSLDQSISELFNDFFVVPKYQREYVWQAEQVEALLNDVLSSSGIPDGESQEYFVGGLVVAPLPDSSFEVIDGQQRITSFFVTLCALRDFLLKTDPTGIDSLRAKIRSTTPDARGHDISRYRVEAQYADSGRIVEKIGEERPAPHLLELETIADESQSIANLKEAYQTVLDFLNKELKGEPGLIRKFFVHLLRHVKVVRITASSQNQGFKIFETLNNRGVGLLPEDLLKNLLFMEAEPDDYKVIHEKWKTMANNLNASRENPTRFLRYYILSDLKTGTDKLTEDGVYKWMSLNKKKCGLETDPVGFVDRLVACSAAVQLLLQGKDPGGRDVPALRNLKTICGSARQHLLPLLAARHFRKEPFAALCDELEKVFFIHQVTNTVTRELEAPLMKWAAQLRSMKGTDEDVQRFVAEEIRPVKTALAGKFVAALSEMDFSIFGKRKQKYFLAKLAQTVDKLAWGDKGHNDLSPYLKEEVEHILPQNSGCPACLAFDKPAELYRYVHKIGNVLLLEKTPNAAARDKNFTEKKEFYASSKFLIAKVLGGFVPPGKSTKLHHAISKAGLGSYARWTSAEIDARTNTILELSRLTWLS